MLTCTSLPLTPFQTAVSVTTPATAAAVTDQCVITAFRDRSEKEIRDIAVTRLENGKWSDARTVHDDNWEVDSCPVNGPAISARGSQVAVAWFTAKDNKGRSFAAFSSDAGRTWGQPIALEDQVSRGYVDIELLDDGSAVAAWVEFEGGRSQFKVRRIEPSGARSSSITIANGDSGVVGYPRLARSGQELVFAWTEGKDEERIKWSKTSPYIKLPIASAPAVPFVRRKWSSHAIGQVGRSFTKGISSASRAPSRNRYGRPVFGCTDGAPTAYR